jgi:hypothetical protein
LHPLHVERDVNRAVMKKSPVKPGFFCCTESGNQMKI